MPDKKQFLTLSESTGIRLLENVEGYEHIHSRAEFAVVISGSVWVRREKQEYLLSSQDAAFLMPYELHAYRSEGESKVIIAEFEPFHFEELNGLVGCSGDFFTVSEATTVYLMSIYPNRNSSAVYLKAFVYPVFNDFMQKYDLQSKGKNHSPLIQSVYRFIEEHYTEDLTLRCAAEKLGCSYVYLSRIFSAANGLSFTTYLNRLRVIQSLKLLNQTDETITEVAYECGFGSVRSYNRAFMKYLCMTPREYREHGYRYYVKG